MGRLSAQMGFETALFPSQSVSHVNNTTLFTLVGNSCVRCVYACVCGNWGSGKSLTVSDMHINTLKQNNDTFYVSALHKLARTHTHIDTHTSSHDIHNILLRNKWTTIALLLIRAAFFCTRGEKGVLHRLYVCYFFHISPCHILHHNGFAVLWRES